VSQRLAILNQKGGVGKTTTTVNRAAGLARRGVRVLALDLDPQSHLTLHLNGDPEDRERSLARGLLGEKGLAECIVASATPGLDLVPASVDLAACETALEDRSARETLLRSALEKAEGEGLGHEILLFDCPPSLGILTLNALAAARGVLVPLQAEFFSLQGLSRLLELVRMVQRRLHPVLEVTGVLPCLVDARRSLTAEVLAELDRHLGGKLLPNRIRISVRLAEAPGFGRTIFQHAPNSSGALDYLELAREVAGRLGLAAAASGPEGA